MKDVKVLNARQHEQEAHIIANAGMPGAVTIATNMAGRGTDIQLGGNLEMRVDLECDGLEGEEREKRLRRSKPRLKKTNKNHSPLAGFMWSHRAP